LAETSRNEFLAPGGAAHQIVAVMSCHPNKMPLLAELVNELRCGPYKDIAPSGLNSVPALPEIFWKCQIKAIPR
jgi:hypothetical protein